MNLFGGKEAVKEQQCDDDENDDKTLVHLLPFFVVADRMHEWIKIHWQWIPK